MGNPNHSDLMQQVRAGQAVFSELLRSGYGLSRSVGPESQVETLQQSPAEIVRDKYRNNERLLNATTCSAELRPRTRLNTLRLPAAACLGLSAALVLLALHLARKASSGKGAASSDLDGSR